MSPHSKRVQIWFDRLETNLEAEAQQAGLFEHGTMIGSAREFLVKRVLRSILPPLLHIGSGKIIDAVGNSSKQVDIILYDSRFPVFEIESGVGLYPIEGVLGTIEVKSSLTQDHLRKALENTRSILALSASIYKESKWSDRIEQLVKEQSINADEATRKLSYEVIPASYVFAYNTCLSFEKLSSAVNDWFNGHGEPSIQSGLCAVLPRIIVAGQRIGLLDDGYIQIDPGDDVRKEWYKQCGPTARALMSFWDTKRRFGFLAAHILHTVSARLRPSHATSGCQYSSDHYYQGIDYFEVDMKGKGALHICWKGNK